MWNARTFDVKVSDVEEWNRRTLPPAPDPAVVEAAIDELEEAAMAYESNDRRDATSIIAARAALLSLIRGTNG